MLDIKLIKNKKDEIEQALRKRMPECSLDNIVEMDNQRLELQRKLDDLLSFRNKKSKEIAIKKREGKDVADLIEKMKDIGDYISEIKEKLNAVTRELKI